jgi:hypothetical protein
VSADLLAGPDATTTDAAGVPFGVAATVAPAWTPELPPDKAPSWSLASETRRSLEVHAYVGPMGSGKSMCAVYDVLPTLYGARYVDEHSGEAGWRQVWSTVRLLNWWRQAEEPEESEAAWAALGLGPSRNPLALPHPLYRPLRTWDDLLQARFADILLDEVQGVANAREWASVPGAVQDKMFQLRRADCRLLWTTVNWMAAETTVRRATRGVTESASYRPARRSDGERVYRSRKVFKWRTFDAAEFDEWNVAQGKGRKIRPEAKQRFKREGEIVERAYDTLDAVARFTTGDGRGGCPICSKPMRKEMCKGHGGER